MLLSYSHCGIQDQSPALAYREQGAVEAGSVHYERRHQWRGVQRIQLILGEFHGKDWVAAGDSVRPIRSGSSILYVGCSQGRVF